MDLISVSALVALLSKISGGGPERTGEQLWESLSTVVRRVFGRRSTSVEAVKRLGERPGDADSIRALAQALVDDSRRDPQAAAQLRRWVAGAQRALSDDERVTNPLSGDGILRSRDIHGNITF